MPGSMLATGSFIWKIKSKDLTVLVKALEEYIKECTVYKESEYTLYVSDYASYRKYFLHRKRPLIRIIVDLEHTLVPWDSLVRSVQDHLEKRYSQYKAIDCLWYVCSSHGGIYLYETLAVKEAKKVGRLRNSFIILNTDNGTVSFGPGHAHNKEFSQRLGQILRSSRFFTREKWLEQLFDVFALSECIRYKGGCK